MIVYLRGNTAKTPSVIDTEYVVPNVEITDYISEGLSSATAEVTIENAKGSNTYNSNGEQLNYVYKFDFSNRYYQIADGENKITYTVNVSLIGINPNKTFTISFIIQGVKNHYPLKPWTVEEVIDRALQIAEPLRLGEAPSFRLRKDLGGVSNKQFTAFAPEFTFTRMNLREVMQTIGGVLHAAPRLQLYDPVNAAAMGLPLYSGEWFFEKFGNEKLATYKDREDGQEKPYNEYRYTTRKCSHEIEQACTKLDSYMDNLVNRINWQNGTITSPSSAVNYGVTLRAENLYLRLNEDSTGTYLLTDFPIDKLVKLEVIQRDTDGNLITPTKDITPYVFPKSVYDNLSSHGGKYPTSKSYALYFTPGEKDIKGFFFKAPSGFSGTDKDYTITNILKTVGISAKNNDDYMRAEFRITYVPIYSTRIQHSKAYLGDHLAAPRTLNYSQSDNSVETRFFGENIKGAAQRLGTAEKFVTFNIKRLKNVPKAGDLWDDDYYISTVQISALQDRFEITCGLSQHFNRKSKYIGADSHKRIYEVSETMVQQRHTVMEDYIVIEPATGESETAGLTKAEYDNSNFGEPLMYGWGINEFWNVIGLSTATKIYAERVQSFTFKGFNFNRQPIIGNTVTLPCVTSAFGNVIEFTAECTDNFSAGTQVEKTTAGKITGFFTKGTEYADYYGRMYYIGWAFGKGWIDDTLTPTNDEYAKQALAIPQDTISKDVQQIAAGTGFDVNNLQLYRKDSREALKFTYRLETVAGDKSFIIGSALSSCNPLVIAEDLPKRAAVFVLKEPLGRFDTHLPGNSDAVVGNATISVQGSYATSAGLPSWVTGKAWAIAFPYYDGKTVDVEDETGTVTPYTPKYGGEILIGRNIDVSVGDSVGDFVAYVVHDLQAYITERRKSGKLKI